MPAPDTAPALNVRGLVVGPLQGNCFIARDPHSEQAAVIDPGGDADAILRALEETGAHAACLINTHGHADHVAANKSLRDALGCPILIHAADLPLLGDEGRKMALWFGLDFEEVQPDRLLEEGDVVEFGDGRLTVLHTPGHSPGSISLLAEDRVFTGDCPGGSESDLFRSIETRLLTLDDDIIVHPGHGPDTTIGRERRSNPFLAGLSR
jgi:hydroxyacylglutathione hydrolase